MSAEAALRRLAKDRAMEVVDVHYSGRGGVWRHVGRDDVFSVDETLSLGERVELLVRIGCCGKVSLLTPLTGDARPRDATAVAGMPPIVGTHTVYSVCSDAESAILSSEGVDGNMLTCETFGRIVREHLEACEKVAFPS